MFTSMFRKAMLGDTALLSLDFTAGTVPTALTFTRADSTARATYIDASGYVKTVASAGAARFDYVGGVAKGLLIEASATNLFTYSEDFSNGSWLKSNATASTDATTAPDGNSTADYMLETAGTSTRYFAGNAGSPGTSTEIRTFSVYVKGGLGRQWVNLSAANGSGGPYYRITADLSAGTIGSTELVNTGTWFSTTPTSSISAAGPSGSGWYRISITGRLCQFYLICPSDTATPGGANTNFGLGSAYAGDTNKGVILWGAQLEANSSASSYIPTTTASLTRLADDAVIRSTAWTSLYAQPGAMVVEFYRGAYGAGDRSIMSTDTTATRHWHLKQANASATAQIAFSAGSPVTQTGLVSGLNKVAIAWNAPTPTSSFDLCVNGATPTFGGSNVGTTLSTWLTLGSQSTTGVSGSGTWDGYLNNSIKSVKYYSALTYAEMIAKTT
jgi:hypothetical protein